MNKLKSKNRITPFKKSLILHEYGGLEYVTITHIPIFRIGDPYPPNEIRMHSRINEAVAKAILRKNILIRGKELHFLRKGVLGLSLQQFSQELNVTLVTIFNWEKEKEHPLHPINELAVRVLLAEKLGIRHQFKLRKSNTESRGSLSNLELRISAKNLVKFNETCSE